VKSRGETRQGASGYTDLIGAWTSRTSSERGLLRRETDVHFGVEVQKRLERNDESLRM